MGAMLRCNTALRRLDLYGKSRKFAFGDDLVCADAATQADDVCAIAAALCNANTTLVDLDIRRKFLAFGDIDDVAQTPSTPLRRDHWST